METAKHDWQSGKLLPEEKRIEIINKICKSGVNKTFIFSIILILITLVMLIVSLIDMIFYSGNIGAGLLGIFILPGTISIIMLDTSLKQKKLKKILETGDFVFSKEEIKNLHGGIINDTKTFYEPNSLTEMKLTNEILLIRKSMNEKDTVYSFLENKKDCTSERIPAIEWKQPEELPKLKEYQEIFPDKFFKNFLWCEATIEGLHKIDKRVGYGKHKYTVTEIKYIYANGLSCHAVDTAYWMGEKILLYRNPEGSNEVLAYHLK